MTDVRKGIRLAISPARKLVLELMHHARKVPSLPLSRVVNVGNLAAVRRDGFRPSWTAIFMRAYALVAQRHPELRRALIPWPWQHFYEHPISEAAVLIEREWQGEQVVLGAKIREPESKTV